MTIDWSDFVHTAVSVGIRILLSLLFLLIAFKLINRLSKRLEKKLLGSVHADKTLTKSLLYISRIALKILAVACIVSFLGINTSGLSALIASLGVCVGLAINGTLSNLAGGFMLLVTRPFKVDDYIAADGFEGTVEDIHIATTSIRTIDNKLVYIPNGTLSTTSIVNYTAKESRRVDLIFSVSYSEDFRKAESVILDLCAANERILTDPAPFVRVCAHSASSIDLMVRAWCKTADYWTVYFDLMEGVKQSFDASAIEIPFEQLDVHVKQ